MPAFIWHMVILSPKVGVREKITKSILRAWYPLTLMSKQAPSICSNCWQSHEREIKPCLSGYMLQDKHKNPNLQFLWILLCSSHSGYTGVVQLTMMSGWQHYWKHVACSVQLPGSPLSALCTVQALSQQAWKATLTVSSHIPKPTLEEPFWQTARCRTEQ